MTDVGILVKALAVLLTVGQLNNPATIRTTPINKDTERAIAVGHMHNGCKLLMDRFKDVAGMDLSALDNDPNDPNKTDENSLEVALSQLIENAKISDKSTEILKGVDVKEAKDIYLEVCKARQMTNSLAPIAQAIDFYNDAIKDLPPETKLQELKNKRLSQSSTLMDVNGKFYTEVYATEGRRSTVNYGEIPDHVKKAFVSIEDRRFYQHGGVDEIGLLRAFMTNMSSTGRPEGGSTITQQVVKNLVVGDEYNYQRKIREMIMAVKLDKMKILSKDEILSLYLNYIYLGRSSWGVDMAAKTYFGRSIKDVTLAQGAYLAGLTHKPNKYNLSSSGDEAVKRRNEVLKTMLSEKYITNDQYTAAIAEPANLAPYENPRAKSSLYFISDARRYLMQEAKIDIFAENYKVYSTIQPDLQKATEFAVQEGIWNFERSLNRATFEKPEGNIEKLVNPPAPAPRVNNALLTPQQSPAVTNAAFTVGSVGVELAAARTGARRQNRQRRRAPAPLPELPVAETQKPWREIMQRVAKPLIDVQWDLAVVTRLEGRRIMVGLKDGREMPLSTNVSSLKLWDLIYVRVQDNGKMADLRTRPKVQGAAIVIENATGRVLSMVGGFSYAVNEVNRASAFAAPWRQAGSTVKPFVFLAALQKGFQPNTLVYNSRQVFQLPGRDWSPKNYAGDSSGPITLRSALEQSKNIPTARWLDHLGNTREESFEYIRKVWQDMGIYNYAQIENSPELQALYKGNERGLRNYKTQYSSWSSLLGTAPTRLPDLAGAYAAIANGGFRPKIRLVDRVEKNGAVVFTNPHVQNPLLPPPGANPTEQMNNRASAYQLKAILQGTVLRGTAAQLKRHGEFMAGKTGTSSNNRDVLFAGFTNEVTVIVWIGYDQQQTLGSRATGGTYAAPIVESIITKSWDILNKKTPLRFTDQEVDKYLVQYPIDQRSGAVLSPGSGGFLETFRVAPESIARGGKDFYNTNLQIVGQYSVPGFDEPPTSRRGFPTVDEEEDSPFAPEPQFRREPPPQRRMRRQDPSYPFFPRNEEPDFSEPETDRRRRRYNPSQPAERYYPSQQNERVWGPGLR